MCMCLSLIVSSCFFAGFCVCVCVCVSVCLLVPTVGRVRLQLCRACVPRRVCVVCVCVCVSDCVCLSECLSV